MNTKVNIKNPKIMDNVIVKRKNIILKQKTNYLFG